MVDEQRADPRPVEADGPPLRRGPGRPRKVPVERQREQILAAATRLFADHGHEGTTSDQIADAAGVGRPTVYDLVGTKHDVYLAAVDRAVERLLHEYGRLVASSGNTPGRARSRRHVQLYFDLLHSHRDELVLLQTTDVAGASPVRATIRRFRRRIEEAVARDIQENPGVVEAGGLPDGDALLVGAMILASAEAAAFRAAEDGDPPPDLSEMVADFCFDGMVAVAARPR